MTLYQIIGYFNVDLNKFIVQNRIELLTFSTKEYLISFLNEHYPLHRDKFVIDNGKEEIPLNQFL